MSRPPEAQDRLYVRGLLAESEVDESPELVAALLSLRSTGQAAAPDPTGKLADLLAGTPVPLARKPRRGRGMVLGVALIGAMAAGAGGVAANSDFLVRADPEPVISFTPDDAPAVDHVEPQVPSVSADPAGPEPAGDGADAADSPGTAAGATMEESPVAGPAGDSAASLPDSAAIPGAAGGSGPGAAGTPDRGQPGPGHGRGPAVVPPAGSGLRPGAPGQDGGTGWDGGPGSGAVPGGPGRNDGGNDGGNKDGGNGRPGSAGHGAGPGGQQGFPAGPGRPGWNR